MIGMIRERLRKLPRNNASPQSNPESILKGTNNRGHFAMRVEGLKTSSP